MPKIDEIYAKLKGSSVYSTFDMRSGYYHMGLSAESQAKSAFVIGGPHTAKFEFKVCPFGLAQAPAYFQRMVNEVLRGLPFAFVYLDDILIFSPDMDTHLKHVSQLFDRLREADLKLKESKCNFLKAHVQYLGHLISGKGIEPVPEKLESIKNMPPPTTPKEVKQFLGLIGYYRKFIPKFSDVARPLTNLTKKDVLFEWTPDCQQTFQLLKDLLMAEPILNIQIPINLMCFTQMLVNMHGHVSLPKNMSMKMKENLRRYIILLHMPVDCLRVVKLIGLPSLKKHMLFIDL